MGKEIRNELLGVLADINNIISSLELDMELHKEKAAELVPQLLSAYSLKAQILDRLSKF